jgi:hypothetical protein
MADGTPKPISQNTPSIRNGSGLVRFVIAKRLSGTTNPKRIVKPKRMLSTLEGVADGPAKS